MHYSPGGLGGGGIRRLGGGGRLDRVPVLVIPIQGRTLLQCKKCGSIRKFEAPYL